MINLIIRQWKEYGQLALCDEDGNVLPMQQSLCVDNSTAPPTVTVRFIIDGERVKLSTLDTNTNG